MAGYQQPGNKMTNKPMVGSASVGAPNKGRGTTKGNGAVKKVGTSSAGASVPGRLHVAAMGHDAVSGKINSSVMPNNDTGGVGSITDARSQTPVAGGANFKSKKGK